MCDLEDIESTLTSIQTRRSVLKRKLENLDKENIPPQQQSDDTLPTTTKKSKVFNSEKASLRQLVDNFTQTNRLESEHENVLLLNMNCHSDPLYDDWINNHPNKLAEAEEVKVAAPSMAISESSYELFSITEQARIEPCEVYHHHNETPNESDTENVEKIEKPVTKKKETKVIKTVVPTLEKLIRNVPNTNPEAKEINYALELIKKMFSVDEIKTGLFGNKYNKSSSKVHVPFDYDKTQEFKGN